MNASDETIELAQFRRWLRKGIAKDGRLRRGGFVIIPPRFFVVWRIPV